MKGDRNAIEVAGLEKTFRIPEHRVQTLKERALHPLRSTRYNEFNVLQDISFEVRRGEFFGILGRNGSGKSTLLKCLAGIYRAEGGEIRIAGRVAPFIELGVGFAMDLTAHENVVINGVMMGMTPAESRERFPDIIEFAGLEQFTDLKLKNYSSGMQVRLAFATMIQSEADVMLIDEVLAVGDAAFQQKCFDVFDDLRAQGKTIILVTHDMGLVERFCDRALLIHEHRLVHVGDPERVAQRYLDINFEDAPENDGSAAPGAVGELAIPTASVTATGAVDGTVPFGEDLTVEITIEPPVELRDAELRVWIEDASGVEVFAASTLEFGRQLPTMQKGRPYPLKVTFENRLSSGRYYVAAMVSEQQPTRRVLAVRHRAATFEVVGGDHVGGVFDVRHEIEMGNW